MSRLTAGPVGRWTSVTGTVRRTAMDGRGLTPDLADQTRRTMRHLGITHTGGLATQHVTQLHPSDIPVATQTTTVADIALD